MLPNNEVRVPPRQVAPSAPRRDITAEFTEAASSKSQLGPFSQILLTNSQSYFVIELRTGQLVKDATFTLFEAVGALEVRPCHTGK
jgi:hypothetical protein